MSDELVNKGLVLIGDYKNKAASPIAVIGTARGGTSMVAGVLAKLGVFMGDNAVPPVYEDTVMSIPFEAKDLEAAKKIALGYSQKHQVWGYKRPSLINRLDEVNQIFAQPRYIFIYKDILSIANRNSISMLNNTLAGMSGTLCEYQKTIDFISSAQPCAMLLSFDKAILYKEDFVRGLIEFGKIEATDDQIKAAVAFINVESTEYLDNTRITKAEGFLDKVNELSISGWARYVHTKEPAKVDIFINDIWIDEIAAQDPRPDLEREFGQDCAFNFTLPTSSPLKSGDKVSIRVKNEIRDVRNSPYIFE